MEPTKFLQLAPLSIEYCQSPLVLSTAVTAIASTALPSGSVIEPSTTMAAILVPGLLALLVASSSPSPPKPSSSPASSGMAVRVGD